MLSQLKNNFFNFLGKNCAERFIVFESDDWGSIRMPSKDAFNYLKRTGKKPELDPYLSYDCLESERDLSRLFEVLCSVKDSFNNFPVITANMVMANPDFDKISGQQFQHYYYKNFIETYIEYYGNIAPFNMVKKGMREGIFIPQYHGREHLNIYKWINALKINDHLIHEAFKQRMLSISSVDHTIKYSYMASLDFFSKEESISKSSILSDGIDIFKELFGFAPVSFIANCYIWHSSIEENLFTEGIRHIQGIPYQYSPFLSKSGEKSYKRVFHYQGEKNRIGQTYFVRNVFFEPSIYNKIDSVNETMKRIEIAFRYGKPAVISTHRLNYIGSINERNQIDNLKSLKCLLSSIVRKWPDVQFIPTNKLLDVYNS